jgi:hypothetical protein
LLTRTGIYYNNVENKKEEIKLSLRTFEIGSEAVCRRISKKKNLVYGLNFTTPYPGTWSNRG